MGLTGCRLKTHTLENFPLPILEFLYFDPKACDASSIILNLYFLESFLISNRSQGYHPNERLLIF